MPEAIIDLEDREFNSSLGHWTGDAGWAPGPVHSYYGLMEFVCEPFGPKKIASLKYPHLKIPKNRTCLIEIVAGKSLSVWGAPYIVVNIKDDLGTDILLEPPYFPIVAFQGFGYWFETPPEWNQETGTILLAVYNPDEAEGGVYLKWFSVQYEVPTKIQYLPLMGIG